MDITRKIVIAAPTTFFPKNRKIFMIVTLLDYLLAAREYLLYNVVMLIRFSIKTGCPVSFEGESREGN